MATATFTGNPVEVPGSFPRKGQKAPAFELVGTDLEDVSLDDYAGKCKVLNSSRASTLLLGAASTRRS